MVKSLLKLKNIWVVQEIPKTGPTVVVGCSYVVVRWWHLPASLARPSGFRLKYNEWLKDVHDWTRLLLRSNLKICHPNVSLLDNWSQISFCCHVWKDQVFIAQQRRRDKLAGKKSTTYQLYNSSSNDSDANATTQSILSFCNPI